MRDQVARVRVWLMAGTVVLVLLVVAFLGYAHYRSRVFLRGLPARLGAEIARETNGYTYSQTVQGRTIFTLHAAKMEQRKDGVVRLHDVGVVLYGRKQDRADRISGSEFEYDQAKGVVRALGLVHMDLEAPAPVDAGGKKQRLVNATGGELAGQDARVIHVQTSGLVYLTNLGVAATGEDLEFSEGSLTGRARGAEYNSDTGIVVLQSAVRVNGSVAGGPMVLSASRAELDQVGMIVTLEGAKVVTPQETVEATHALVHVRKDGSPERMEGSGRVTISRAEGDLVVASQAEAALSSAGRPEAARLWGGVRYTGEEDGRKTQGTTPEARVRFDAAGLALGVTATGGAMLESRQGQRLKTLTAASVEVALGAGSGRNRRDIRDVVATGTARVLAVDGVQRTEMAGDVLKAQFSAGQLVSRVWGDGHTVLHQADGAGREETSAGDKTEMLFRELEDGKEELVRAEQAGKVAFVRRSLRQGSTAEERGTAERAVYAAARNEVTLSGAVMVRDERRTVWAEKVTLDRASGDAKAEGMVRLTYLQEDDGAGSKEREPVHVVASRAELHGVEGGETKRVHRAVFSGDGVRMTRLWQGASQVEAPVIEMEEGARRLTARGDGGATLVHTTLLSSEEGRPRSGAGDETKKRVRRPGATRVLSREMVYTDGAREVVFTGEVEVVSADGTMKAERATAYLEEATSGSKHSASGMPGIFPGAGVQRMVATGRVEIDQPGRHARGEQLVYTAADGNFVLTGTAAVAPRVEDAERGTVTGEVLQFHAGDDSVVVRSAGIQSAGGGVRRRTETRVKQ